MFSTIAINLFIICYLALAFLWNLPNDSFAKRCIQKIKPLILWPGLWHSWSMFAPSPIKVERRLSVLLTMKDGTTETHELFKVQEASKWAAFVGVRERKFQTVLSKKKNNKSQRAAICNYTKRRSNDPNNVAKSELILKKRKIKRMDETKDHEVEERVVWRIKYSNKKK